MVPIHILRDFRESVNLCNIWEYQLGQQNISFVKPSQETQLLLCWMLQNIYFSFKLIAFSFSKICCKFVKVEANTDVKCLSNKKVQNVFWRDESKICKDKGAKHFWQRLLSICFFLTFWHANKSMENKDFGMALGKLGPDNQGPMWNCGQWILNFGWIFILGGG